MPNATQRMEILQKLERGEITPAQAEQMLTGMLDIPPAAAPSRMSILEQVENGTLSADEATQALMGQAARVDSRGPEAEAEESFSFDEVAPKKIWKVFLVLGLLVTVASTVWMNFILQRSGMNFWFYCTWLPFASGILIIALAWMARNSTWVQLDLRSNSPGKHLYLTLPVPVKTIQRIAQRLGKSGRIVVNDVENISIHLGGGKRRAQGE